MEKKERKQRTSILTYATPEELAIIEEIHKKCRERKRIAEMPTEADYLKAKIAKAKAKYKKLMIEAGLFTEEDFDDNEPNA